MSLSVFHKDSLHLGKDSLKTHSTWSGTHLTLSLPQGFSASENKLTLSLPQGFSVSWNRLTHGTWSGTCLSLSLPQGLSASWKKTHSQSSTRILCIMEKTHLRPTIPGVAHVSLSHKDFPQLGHTNSLTQGSHCPGWERKAQAVKEQEDRSAIPKKARTIIRARQHSYWLLQHPL